MRGRTRHTLDAPLRGSTRRPWATRLRGAVVVVATAVTVVALAPAASAAYAPEPMGPTNWVPNGGVHAVVAAGDRVYVGGNFTGGVAAINATTGALAWLGNANGDVRALALGPNGSLLLGGAFTTVGGITHRKIASVNAATGAVNNTFRGSVGGTVRDIVVVGNTAYFGGQFTNHSGFTQRALGAVDATTGTRVTAFTTAANDGNVYALATDGTKLFIGGNFTGVGGQARNQLASVTLSSHTLDAWNPARACTACNVIWDLTARGDWVYTAGRNSGGLYIVHKATGATVHKLGGFNGDTQAVAVAPDGRLYLGGHFITVSGVTRELVAEFDVSGPRPVLKEFSTNFVTSWPGVWAMAATATRLFVGGDFTVAGTQTKKYPYFAMFPSTSAPPADTTVPTLTGTSPTAGTSGVPVTSDATATFSEPVTGVSKTNFTLTPTAGGPAVDAAVSPGTGNTWVLNPTVDLAAGTQYTATLGAGITDGADNAFGGATWTFTTAAATGDTVAPTVTATHPKNGAVGINTGVSPNALFSEAVTDVTTNFTLARTDNGEPIPGRVVWNATLGRWVFNPDPTLDANTSYTATVTTGVTDLLGNPLAAPVTWTFTTA